MKLSFAVEERAPGPGSVPAARVNVELRYAAGFVPGKRAARRVEIEAVERIEAWLRDWKAARGLGGGCEE